MTAEIIQFSPQRCDVSRDAEFARQICALAQRFIEAGPPWANAPPEVVPHAGQRKSPGTVFPAETETGAAAGSAGLTRPAV